MITLFKGKETIKRIRVIKKKPVTAEVTPFFGVYGEENPSNCYFGVGLEPKDKKLIKYMYGNPPEFSHDNTLCFSGTREHNLPAGYRTMEIAQMVYDFKFGTMCSCAKYGGLLPKSNIDNIFDTEEKIGEIIGKENLERITSRDILPDMGPAADALISRGIDIGIEYLIEELRSGKLEMTPGLKKAFEKISEKELVLKGMPEKYKDTVKIIEHEPGIKSKIEDYFMHKHAAEKYILSAEEMINNLGPELDKDYQILESKIRALPFENSFVIPYIQGKESTILLFQKKAGDAIQKLKSMPFNELTIAKKFLSYKDALHELVESLSKISFNTNSMPYWIKISNNGNSPEYDDIKAAENHSDDLIKKINKAVMRYMPEHYSFFEKAGISNSRES